MSGPTIPQKLEYMHAFAMRDDVGKFCSHYWKMVGVGIQLVAWGGNKQTFNRLFNWDELNTLPKAHVEGAIKMTFEQVRKADAQSAEIAKNIAKGAQPKQLPEREILPDTPAPEQEVGIFG